MSLLDNLVSYWKLDEASGARADSVGSNNLTDNNSVGSDAGKISNSAVFVAASSKFLSVADNASLDFSTGFAFSAWIYSSLSGQMNIGSKWAYPTQGGWYIDLQSSGNLEIGIAASLGDGGGQYAVTSGGPVAANTWTHVVIVYDGSGGSNATRLMAWVNGVQKTLSYPGGSIPTSLINNSADLNIGKFSGLGRYFDGKVDEAGLWSRSITSGEIGEIYNSGAGLTYPFSTAATVERSVSFSATASVETQGTFFTLFERSAAFSAVGAIETSAQFFSTLERSASINATASVDAAAIFFSVVERSILVEAVGSITVSGQRMCSRSASFESASNVSVSGSFFSTFERAVSCSAVAGISITSQRELSRSYSISAVALFSASGHVKLEHERSVSFSVTTGVNVSGVGSTHITQTVTVLAESRVTIVSSESRSVEVPFEDRSGS